MADTKRLMENLQTDLRLLSNEARKKFPQVKDAAESCLVKVRNIHSGGQVSDEHVVARLRQGSNEVLHPFLMGCATKNPRIVQISLGCIQKIISSKALESNASATIVNELWSLMEAECEELKLLQTLTLLVSTDGLVRGQTLARCLVICFRLHFAKDSVVINTASASVRQLVGLVFERVLLEDSLTPASSAQNATPSKSPTSRAAPKTLGPSAADAYMLFQDLCLLVNAEHPVWLLGITEMTRTLGLELLEAVLTTFVQIFSAHAEFSFLLKEQVCPLVIKLFSPNLKFVQVTSQHPHSRQDQGGNPSPPDRPYFPIVMRLLRVVAVLVTLYYDLLVTECEIFLSLLVKFLDGDKLSWQRALALEVLHKITAKPDLLKQICANYDQKPHATKVLQEIINNLGGYVQAAFIQQEVANQNGNNNSLEGDSNSNQMGAQPGFSYRGVWIPLSFIAPQGTPKALFLELLDKHEPPSLPDGYCLSLAYASLIDATHSVQQAIQSEPTDIDLSRQLLESTHVGILSALSLLLEASTDENVTENLLKSFCTLLNQSCLLGQWGIRDACLGAMCKAALPPHYMVRVLNTPAEARLQQKDPSLAPPAAGDSGLAPSNVVAVGTPCPTPGLPSSVYAAPVMLTAKNLQAMRSLISAAQTVSQYLQESWYLVLVSLEHLVWILGLKPGVGGVLKSGESSDANTGTVLTTAVMADVPVLSSMLSKLFELTSSMDDVGLHHVIAALCKMSNSAMEVSGGSQGREPSFFPVAKLMHCGLVNLNRVDVFWKAMHGHLVEVAGHSFPKLREWGAKAIVSLIHPAFSSAKSDSLDSTKLQQLIFSPLVDLCDVSHEDVRGIQITCLMQILQGKGQTLDPTLWPKIIEVIGTIAAEENNFGENVMKQGYQAVHLLATDFLPSLSTDCIKQLIEVVTKFGIQKQELNISLSAVGQLWTLSDYLFRKRVDFSSADLNNIWLGLYHCLSALCVDTRPPIRKSACQTLLQTVASHGCALEGPTWRLIIWKVLFPLLEKVVLLTETASTTRVTGSGAGGSAILMHHSRDTESKQWAETYVQTLSGVVRIFNAQIQALHSLDDFANAWNSILEYISAAATSQSGEISLAALKSFQELLQGKSVVPSEGKSVGQGAGAQAAQRSERKASDRAEAQARCITSPLWLAAWQSLTQLKKVERPRNEPPSPSKVDVICEEPKSLSGAGASLPLPSPAHLTSLLHVFPLLFERTKSVLDSSDIPRLGKVLRGVTSLPISTDQAPFILPTAADLTPSQEAVLDCVKVVYQEVSRTASMLRPTLPNIFTLLLTFVEFSCKAPEPLFMDKKTSTNNVGCADWVVQNYVPFAELCLRKTVEYFSETAHFAEIIEAGILIRIVKTLRIPLGLKYNCPAQSTWKLAASSLLSVLGLGLPIARQNAKHFRPVWQEISGSFEEFLFPKSEASPNLSSEERKKHEFIDCQFIDLIRQEVLPFASVLPKEFVQKIIEILNKGSISLTDTKDVLGIESMHKQRSDLSRACFEALLAMSQGEPDVVKCSGGVEGRRSEMGIGGDAVSSLLSRCKNVIGSFVEEEKAGGGIPLPQQRVSEMLSVLGAVTTLMESLRKHSGATSRSDHDEIWQRIIDLYPDLVLCIPAKNQDVRTALIQTLQAYHGLLKPPQ